MVKKIIFVLTLLAMIPSLTVGARPKAKGGTGEMSVQVREVIVRKTPAYLGAQAGTLTYGAKVKVLGEDGNFYQIESPAGYLPKSALTKSKVNMNADQKYSAGTTAKHDEVALAGKGFSPQIEAKYKKDNPQTAPAYESVDTVEKFGATEAELKQFSAAGKLNK